MSIHLISARMSVGGLELSRLPIRTPARCKEKTLRSNSNHEGERHTQRGRESGRQRGWRSISVYQHIYNLQSKKEQILLFSEHLKFRLSRCWKPSYDKIRKAGIRAYIGVTRGSLLSQFSRYLHHLNFANLWLFSGANTRKQE